MHFALTDDQLAITAAAERFASERLAPGYLARDGESSLDRGLVREMGSLGLIGCDLAEDHGGLGVDSVTSGLVIEAIAGADLSVSYVQLLTSLVGWIIQTHAAPEVAAQWVPKLVTGEALPALGLTEPRGGSDAANLKLKATRTNDGYRLDGEKTSISFANQADVLVVFARTGDVQAGARGVTAFVVPMDAPGITRSNWEDLGSTPVGRGSIFFDDVHVPLNALVGGEGEGFVQVMQGFDFSRALIALQCIAPARASVSEAWAYTQARETFGAPLASYQGVTFPLAEFDTQLEAARLLCYKTLWLRDRGEPHTAEAAMVKWWGPKLAYDAIHQCLLTHGHAGYSKDLPFQQRMRDTLGLQIGDGTAQIMKLVIARERVGRVAVQYARQK